jgi:hypothetical protein
MEYYVCRLLSLIEAQLKEDEQVITEILSLVSVHTGDAQRNFKYCFFFKLAHIFKFSIMEKTLDVLST